MTIQGEELKRAVEQLNANADVALIRSATDVERLRSVLDDIMEEVAEGVAMDAAEVGDIEVLIATAEGKIDGLDPTLTDTTEIPPTP